MTLSRFLIKNTAKKMQKKHQKKGLKGSQYSKRILSVLVLERLSERYRILKKVFGMKKKEVIDQLVSGWWTNERLPLKVAFHERKK
jgi:hypothetical protein